MILLIAWKNIWRNKVRSLIIMFAIVFGLFGGLFSSAFMNGLVIQRINSAINNECSNIQVHHPDYSLNKELTDTIISFAGINKVLDTIRQVSAWSPRLKITAMASTANANSGVVLMGIDPEKEKQVTHIWKNIPDTLGNWFLGKKKNGIVVGAKLAEKLKIKLKSKIIMQYQAKDNSLVSNSYTVIGIYRIANTAFEERYVYANYSELKNYLGFENNAAHEIAITLVNDRYNDIIKSQLKSNFPNLAIEGWKELMPDLGMVSEMTTQMLYIILVIILLALCFGIVNTMLMAVMERTHELGMLMAVGMNKSKIFRMIMLETVFLSLTGGIVGMLISAAVIQYFSVSGFSLLAFAKGLEAMGYSAIVYPFLDSGFYAGLTILVIIAGIISSLLPARKALGLNPVEAIRNI